MERVVEGCREMMVDELRMVSQVWGLNIRSALQVTGGFSGACVWKVEAEGGQWYALRRTELADDTEWLRRNAICRWMSLVGRHGVTCVPMPLRPVTVGSVGLRPDPESQDYLVRTAGGVWQMEPWMPGKLIAGIPAPIELSAALQVLEQIHRIGRESALRGEFTSAFAVRRGVSPGVQRRLQIVGELQAGLLAGLEVRASRDLDRRFGQLAERMCRSLRNGLERLQLLLGSVVGEVILLQPVLRDIWRPHLLFHEGRVSGVIDWNAASTDHVALDLTRLLRSWYGEHHNALRGIYRDVSEERRFGVLEVRLLNACDAASVLLSPVTWMRRRYSQAVPGEAEQAVLVRFEELVDTAEQFEAAEFF